MWLFPWNIYRSYATASGIWPPTLKPRFALVEVIDHLVFRFWIPSLRQPPPRVTRPSIERTEEAHYTNLPDDRLLSRKARNIEAARTVVAEAARRRVPVIVGVTPRRDRGVVARLPEEATILLDDLKASGSWIFDATQALGGVGADARRYYYDETHFSVAGHQVIGNTLGEQLWDKLLPIAEDK